MPSDPHVRRASARLSDLLADRLTGGADFSPDAAIVGALETLLREHLLGIRPERAKERMLGFELFAITDAPDLVRLDGWVLLEPDGGPHVRRPLALEFTGRRQGVIRLAADTADRSYDQTPVHGADLADRWQAAFFIGHYPTP